LPHLLRFGQLRSQSPSPQEEIISPELYTMEIRDEFFHKKKRKKKSEMEEGSQDTFGLKEPSSECKIVSASP
jgi:hypothetical protein